MTSAASSAPAPAGTSYILNLSGVPFKAVPILYASILSTNYLLGWEITLLKLVFLNAVIGAFTGLIDTAKTIKNNGSKSIFEDLKVGAGTGAAIGAIFFAIVPSITLDLFIK